MSISPRASEIGLPALRASSVARSARRASIASARACMSAVRSSGVIARQAGNASFARATAASTSAASPRGTSAITSAVAGSTTASVPLTPRPPQRLSSSGRYAKRSRQSSGGDPLALARGRDQRTHHRARVVLLRVPEDPEGEWVVGELDGLDDAVRLRAPADHETLAELPDALMMVGADLHPLGAARPRRQRAGLQGHGVGGERAGRL